MAMKNPSPLDEAVALRRSRVTIEDRVDRIKALVAEDSARLLEMSPDDADERLMELAEEATPSEWPALLQILASYDSHEENDLLDLSEVAHAAKEAIREGLLEQARSDYEALREEAEAGPAV